MKTGNVIRKTKKEVCQWTFSSCLMAKVMNIPLRPSNALLIAIISPFVPFVKMADDRDEERIEHPHAETE